MVWTVTDLVKKIDGVEAAVVWERDFVRDDLQEAELSFYAEDTSGTVWHLGEYTEQFEDGKELIGGQAWLVGHLEGAKAGIFMPADPKAGTPSYSEGFAPAPYYWTDRGQVDRLGESVTVGAGSYKNVLVIKEFNTEEPEAIQLKLYAPGVGNVAVQWTGDDEQKETLELTKIVHLRGAAMDAARREALELEARANVYGSTPPAEPRS